MLRHWLATIVVVATLSPPPAAAAGESAVETLSLQAALERAVSENPQLKRARAEVRGSRALLLAARGSYDLELTAGASYSRRVTPRLGDDDFTGGAWDQNSYRLDLGRRLETGGRIALGWNGSAATTNSRFDCGMILAPGRRCVLQSTGARLFLTQPLLRGLGPAVVGAEIQRQEVRGNIAAVTRLATAAVVVRDIVMAYGQLAFAHQSLTIQRAALELAGDQLRSTEKQVAVGKRARIDVAAAEQGVSSAQLLVSSAEEEVFARSLGLRELMGIDNPIPVTIISVDAMSTPATLVLDEAALISRAAANNPELQAVRLGRRLGDIDLAVARSLLWPQLDLESSVGTVGRSPDAGEALRQAGAFQNTAWFVGLSFGFPLQNREARGHLQHAHVERERMEIDVQAQTRHLRNQVLRLVNALRNGSRRIELAEKTVSFAEMNLKAERARFALGQATNNDVLRVQQDLRQAQLTVAAANLELLVNEAALGALTGDILPRYGLALAAVD